MISEILDRDEVCIVGVQDAMEHSRIDDTYDDLVVQSYLDAAHDVVEQYLNRKLSKTRVIALSDLYCQNLTLPFPPVAEIISVTCEDSDENEITLDEGTHYKYESVSKRIKFSKNWTEGYKYSTFKITYDCGYNNPEEVPRAIVHAIKMIFATFYENREDVVMGVSVSSIPSPAKRICRQYRVRPL